MENNRLLAGSLDRRQAVQLALGSAVVGVALASQIRPASAQTASDIDALNLMINFEYLLTQFESVATGATVPAAIVSGDSGLPGEEPRPGKRVTFATPNVSSVVTEMRDDNRNVLTPLRVVVGALVARQPVLNLSYPGAPAFPDGPFSSIMQRAGVVATNVVFDPYLNETNFLYALLYLKNASVAAYRGLIPTLSNRVVMQNFAGALGAEVSHLATIRSILYAGTSTVRGNADKIAAFQNSLNGGGVFQGISPQSRSAPPVITTSVQVANVTPALPATGEINGRSSGQILNQLYVTNSAATSGGFFPNGVNGSLRTSASA